MHHLEAIKGHTLHMMKFCHRGLNLQPLTNMNTIHVRSHLKLALACR